MGWTAICSIFCCACKVDHGFGHVQFKVRDDMTVAQFVLSMGDRFYSLINDHGFSASLLWQPELMVEDAVDFVAGAFIPSLDGVHWRATTLQFGLENCLFFSQ